MMAEYIERSAAIEAAKHAWAKGLEPSQHIEVLPAADVAPVVLEICPMTLREANAYVEQYHRHHGPVVGQFSPVHFFIIPPPGLTAVASSG
jgi:hypothetical protein